MANPRKPTALKRLQGTLRADRMNPAEPSGLDGRPETPRAFIFGDRADWDRMADTLTSFGVLQEQHAEALYRLVEAMGEALCLASQAKAGREVNQTRRGKVETDIRTWLKDFGMTPSDQSRVSASRPAPENPFNCLRKPTVIPIS